VHASHASIVSKIAHRVYEQEPPPSPVEAWWRALQPNFYRAQEPFLLARKEQLQIGAVAMLDVGLRTAVASVLAASSVGRALKMSEVRRDIEESQMYARLLDEGRALELYPHPAPNLAFHERAPRPPYYRPTAGRCVDLAWESQFTPYAPSIRQRYLSHTENLVARARYFRHDGPARPTIVLLHGFAAEAHAFNERLFQVRWLYERLGIDVVCLTLPFHGGRRGRGSAYTGQRFISEGMCWIAEAFRQTVLDFRALSHFLLHTRGAPSVGVSGVSLGGYTTALLASLEPRLAFAIPNVPVVSLPDARMEPRGGAHAGRDVRDQALARGSAPSHGRALPALIPTSNPQRSLDGHRWCGGPSGVPQTRSPLVGSLGTSFHPLVPRQPPRAPRPARIPPLHGQVSLQYRVSATARSRRIPWPARRDAVTGPRATHRREHPQRMPAASGQGAEPSPCDAVVAGNGSGNEPACTRVASQYTWGLPDRVVTSKSILSGPMNV
jgi:pimeloyl-ACP methyl ester carboxylesterase